MRKLCKTDTTLWTQITSIQGGRMSSYIPILAVCYQRLTFGGYFLPAGRTGTLTFPWAMSCCTKSWNGVKYRRQLLGLCTESAV